MAASVQFCWPSAFRNLAVCVQDLVAADTLMQDLQYAEYQADAQQARDWVLHAVRLLDDDGAAPALGGQPDPSPRAGESSVGPLRWARCPDEGRPHPLPPAALAAATTGSQAQALYGRALAPEGLTITSSVGALRLTHIARIVPHQEQPQSDTHRPVDPRPTASAAKITPTP